MISNLRIYNLTILRKKSISVAFCFRFLFYHKAKENVKNFFSACFWDHGLFVKNGQQWKLSNGIQYGYDWKRKNFPYLPVMKWSHNILYRTRYLVFPEFESHSVLLKIGHYAKTNLVIYKLSMFGKIMFVMTVNYDIINI